MSTTARGKGGGKQAAARSERKPEPKTIEWEGVKLRVPADLPKTVGLDLGRIDAMQRREEPTIGALYALVESLIGDDGMEQVRRALQNSAGNKYDAIDGRVYTDVLDAVLGAYGTSVGESSASTTS